MVSHNGHKPPFADILQLGRIRSITCKFCILNPFLLNEPRTTNPRFIQNIMKSAQSKARLNSDGRVKLEFELVPATAWYSVVSQFEILYG